MTGLNLETFLHLLRADLGAWATLGLIVLVLGLLAWTSWGSRRALRKCLVVSLAAHAGLALYGGTVPALRRAAHPEADEAARAGIRQIKVLATAEGGPEGRPLARGGGASGGGALAPWDRPLGGLALADAKLTAPKTPAPLASAVRPGDRAALGAEAAAPEADVPAPPKPEPRPADEPRDNTPPPPRLSPGGEDDVAPAVVAAKDAETAAPAAPAPRIKGERAVAPNRVAADPPRSAPAAPRVETVGPLPDAAESAPEPVAARGPGPVGSEPAPEPAAGDLPPVDVIAARPEASTGGPAANLRPRSRPPAAPRGTAPARPPLALALRPSPALEGPRAGGDGEGEAPPALAEREPSGGEPAEAGGLDPAPAPVAGAGDVAAAEVVKEPVDPLPRVAPAESNVRQRSRPKAPGAAAGIGPVRRRPSPAGPLALARVVPQGVPALPEIQGAAGGRPLLDVPEVYRSRLDPNRSARAFRSGASPASEQAVERALDWLARHQDIDGRWDGGTAKYDDGTALKGDDDYTVHCPHGEVCFGECVYWEADTALTGLALLAYLGAGYTQTDGKYAETVGRGLDFLRASQTKDGDLRGKSRAVGMYCHAMATIALCEAYAMTGDERLRNPVERAVGFLVRSRSRDGLAWRYLPGAPDSDTSILGWVVMALKSAKEVGIAVPSQAQAGALGWLDKVSSGEAGGLARYQLVDSVNPTMTAEAWVCRQFLGTGGPGPASTEAADYLLAHPTDRGTHNLYYMYYGTLAMYQHGGDAWFRWNGRVRDEIVRRQRDRGHPAGSWDPDDSPYGARGGRIYCTALATLSLEVYYRYLRLYDEPKIPPALAPRRPRGGDRDPALGRLKNAPVGTRPGRGPS